jgi:hypothetical protein
MLAVLILLIVTGWVLYLAPQGQGSRYWELLGINKHLYKDIHLCLSVVATVLFLAHLLLNIKPLMLYCKPEYKGGVKPILFAFTVIILTLTIAVFI